MDLSLDAEVLVLIETLEEDGAKMVGTGAGDGLDGGDAVLGDGGGVGTKDELGSSTGEFWQTSDVEVFMVDRLVGNEIGLRFLDRGKHVRLAIVVTVGTDAEVDLLGVRVGLVRGGQLENAVVDVWTRQKKSTSDA